MCKNHNIQNMDKCMKPLISYLNRMGTTTVACCCGHNRYPMTIVVKFKWAEFPYELLSRKDILRKKRFYVKDSKGYYYIPEVSKEKK